MPGINHGTERLLINNLEKLWWDYAKLTPFYIELATSFIDETISDNNAEKQIRELTEQCKR